MNIIERVRKGGVKKITLAYVKDIIIRLMHGNADIVIKYKKKNKSLVIKNFGFTYDREPKTISLFLMAYDTIKTQLNKNFSMRINCHDLCPNIKIWSYSKTQNQDKKLLIPDYMFLNSCGGGIDDYESCIQEMIEKSKINPKYNNLFYVGTFKNNPVREKLYELSQSDDRIKAIDWGKNKEKFYTIFDHLDYKYLIDLDGISWTDRKKLFLFSGRLLFLPEIKYYEYWTHLLKPWEHYVPVKADLSDLIEKLDWADANPEKCKKIAADAQLFALENLRRRNAVDYFAKQILKLGRK